MSELHRRVSDAIRPLLADEVYQSARIADAVIAALGLVEVTGLVWHHWATPWERIEEKE